MEIKNPTIIRKVSVIDTFRQIMPGQTATFRARELGTYSSACCAVSRLNASKDRPQYSISTNDNGETYTVSNISK